MNPTRAKTQASERELAQIKAHLWSEETAGKYAKEGQYLDHLMEQYKIFVEMADRISARRSGANVFFLSLNTTIITCISFFIKDITSIKHEWVMVFPFLGIMTICYVWWSIIRSYKSLNDGKFKVIQMMAEKLPSTPYKAEWIALGEGKDKKKYSPLTNVEQVIPIIFALLYFFLLVYYRFLAN